MLDELHQAAARQPANHELPDLGRRGAADSDKARDRLRKLCGGDLAALQRAAPHDKLDKESTAALPTLCAAYLPHLSSMPAGGPVARFHLGNGARLKRRNARGNMSPKGLKQSFGIMVHCLYDQDKIEASHERISSKVEWRARAPCPP
jgi:malonyl-CoA decarboxylase